MVWVIQNPALGRWEALIDGSSGELSALRDMRDLVQAFLRLVDCCRTKEG